MVEEPYLQLSVIPNPLAKRHALVSNPINAESHGSKSVGIEEFLWPVPTCKSSGSTRSAGPTEVAPFLDPGQSSTVSQLTKEHGHGTGPNHPHLGHAVERRD
jgi:hypothetical protein